MIDPYKSITPSVYLTGYHQRWVYEEMDLTHPGWFINCDDYLGTWQLHQLRRSSHEPVASRAVSRLRQPLVELVGMAVPMQQDSCGRTPYYVQSE